MILAESLASILRELGYHVEGIKKSLNEAMAALVNPGFDLVLLDINLYQGDEGIEIAQELNTRKKAFIFITSYSDKATLEKAKETMPDGYIVKPFNKESLFANIEIVRTRFLRKIKEESEKARISIFDGHSSIFLHVNDIMWVKSDGVYNEIKIATKKYVERRSLQSLEEKLPANIFCRVHRSWLVNINHVNHISSNEVSISNNSIPVSRGYRKKLKEFLSVHPAPTSPGKKD